jgi:hypothetical protein
MTTQARSWTKKSRRVKSYANADLENLHYGWITGPIDHPPIGISFGIIAWP